MAANRSAGLKHGFMLATAISVTLSGCASVEYNKVSNNATKSQVVPMPKAATDTAYAAPAAGTVVPVANATSSDMAANAAAPAGATAPAAAAAPAQNANSAIAATSPSVGTAGQVMTGAQVASATPAVNPLTASDADAALALAYAPPTLVAIPQPRPDIIAAANSLPMPTDAEEVQAAALQSGLPMTSAAKDVEGLDQRLASADPTPGDLNPLSNSVAVPTPRPGEGSMGLEAYANSPALMARDAMDSMDGFDTSAPKELDAPTLAPSAKLQALIKKYASLYGVPEALVHRVVKRESTYNPSAYHSGNYGLMQIRYNTAKSLGYTGSPSGLFDAETNLKYAVKYLRGAFMVAENNHDNAVRLYARGYYYDAKRKGLLAQVQ